MAEPNRRFTVINGGTAPARQDALVDTGIIDSDGHRYFKGTPPPPPPGDGNSGGGSMKFTLPDLRWNVAILNGLASLFFIGLIGMWLWMVDRIDDKFEAADAKITAISDKVSDLRVEIAGQRADIKTVLEKLDDHAQGRPRAREAGPVHQGAPKQP